MNTCRVTPTLDPTVPRHGGEPESPAAPPAPHRPADPAIFAAASRRGAEPAPCPALMPRHVCVVLHGVTPYSRPACARLLGQLQALAAEAGVMLPVTLLVVPMMHGNDHAPRTYLRWLGTLARDGHELSLQGLRHCDEGPPPRSLRDHLRRHWIGRGEGEFAALERNAAADRLACARAWADTYGLDMPGFVAPAGLLNAAAWDALAAAGFSHTCTADSVVALPGGQKLAAPALVVGSGPGAWHRLSIARNNLVAVQRWRRVPLCRLDLHPAAAEQAAGHAASRPGWARWLTTALRERVPLLLGEAAGLAQLRHAPPAAADVALSAPEHG